MLITTMNDVPGYRIDEVLGECFGLTVRSRGMKGQLGASFKSVVGGELGAFGEVVEADDEEDGADEDENSDADFLCRARARRPSTPSEPERYAHLRRGAEFCIINCAPPLPVHQGGL